MRLALVTTSFLPRIGGAEFVVHNLAHQWSLQGHEVRIFNSVTDNPTHAEGKYTVGRYKVLRGTERFGHHRFPFLWFTVRELSRLLSEYRPDSISAHFAYPVALWLSKLKPVPKFLITCHGPALNETPQGPRQRFGIDRLLADAMNLSVGAVAISTNARRIMEKIGVEPSKILNIPNGVDLNRFQKKVKGFSLRAKFGIPNEATVILSVGRNLWAKAYDTGIQAFGRVASTIQMAYYVIIGRETSDLRPLSRALNIEEKVILCEELYGEDLVGTYQQADIFFMPSIKELCPLVVLEAMAVGLPEVVTNVSGCQDMIHNGKNGIVMEPGDISEMEEALLRLVEDKALRRRMGEANLAEAMFYSWDRISRLYLDAM